MKGPKEATLGCAVPFYSDNKCYFGVCVGIDNGQILVYYKRNGRESYFVGTMGDRGMDIKKRYTSSSLPKRWQGAMDKEVL